MTHARTTIRNSINTILTTAGITTKNAVIVPFDKDSTFPFANILPQNDVVVLATTNKDQNRLFTVVVNVYARTMSSLESQTEIIENAIGADPKLNDSCAISSLASVTYNYENDASADVYFATLTYEIQYFTAASAVSTNL